MMEVLRSHKTRFLQEPYGLTSQRTTFFIVTAVKTSNLTQYYRAGLCSRHVIYLLWCKKRVFISQKTTLSVVTASKPQILQYTLQKYAITRLIPDNAVGCKTPANLPEMYRSCGHRNIERMGSWYRNILDTCPINRTNDNYLRLMFEMSVYLAYLDGSSYVCVDALFQ
jgi:hypothetical protein